MKFKKVLFSVFALLVVSSMVLAACGSAATEAPATEEPAAPPAAPTEAPPTEVPTPAGPPTEPQMAMVADNPVQYDGYDTSDIPTLDPQRNNFV